MRKRRLFTPIPVLFLTLSLGLSAGPSPPVRPEPFGFPQGRLVEGPAYGLRPAGLEESSPATQEEFTSALGLPPTGSSPREAGPPILLAETSRSAGLEEPEAVEKPGEEGEPKRAPLDQEILEAIREKGWAKLQGGGYVIKRGALRQRIPRLILQGELKEPSGLPPEVKLLRATRQTTVSQILAFFEGNQVEESDGVLFKSEDFTHDEMIASLPLSQPAAAAVPSGIEYRMEELEEIFGLARKVGPLYIRSFTWVRWADEELLFIEQA